MPRTRSKQHAVCQFCGETQTSNLRRALIVRPAVVEIIQKEFQSWNENGWICADDLHKYQFKYVQSLLEAEKGELTQLEFEVLEGLRAHEIFAKNPEAYFVSERTFGQRLADALAAFGGSWTFIIVFGVVLFSWMCSTPSFF